ncbi:MAG: hypothetical protein ACRDCW_16430 [Sarcina sp.]
MLDNNELFEKNDEVPREIKKWNWGAFTFNIIWGIGNKSYLPLLSLIPIFNIFWAFVCGFKGNEWAWKSNKFDENDIDAFLATQKTWARAGLIWFIVRLIITIIILSYIIYWIYTFIIAYNYTMQILHSVGLIN